MAVYRFKVVLDDDEEVTRTIEIRSRSSFQEFHNILVKALEVTVPSAGTFFVSDNNWHNEGLIGTYSAEEPAKDSKISSRVHDPHQRFLYELDANVQLSFTIELSRILPDTEAVELPVCTGGEGEIPKYYFKQPDPVKDTGEDLSEGEQSLLKELEAMAMMDLDGEDGEDLDGDVEGDEDSSDGDDDDDYKSDLGLGDEIDDDMDMSGFSEDEDFRE